MATTFSAWDGWNFTDIAQGPAGAPGVAGAQGVKGVQGPTGPTGEVGFQGPPGERGVTGATVKGATAPLSKFFSGDGQDSQYLYQPWTPFVGWRFYGTFTDARGSQQLSLTLKIVNGQERFYGTLITERPTTYGVNVKTIQINNRNPPAGVSDNIGFVDDYNIWLLHGGEIQLIKGTNVRVWDPSIVETPPKTYLFPQVDASPTSGDPLQLVTSGGVAAAYCSLIDKVAQYKGLSAEQVAQMKALYGA